MGWGMLWLFFALKIPLLTLCWLVWWAIHQEPETEEHRDDGGARRRPHPVPKLPRAPRRAGFACKINLNMEWSNSPRRNIL